ncbi:MAG: enoyl-CoA hydratase-related protein [Geminicoccaceae bacterium]
MSVDLSIEKHVARVTIDRPDRMNAIDSEAEHRLQDIWIELEGNRDVRCIVLTGAGDRAFSVGADMKDGGTDGLRYWAEPRPGGFGGIALRTTLNIPVIARVNGYALGGGFEMVLGCDIVIAAEEAQFGLPEPRVGRLPLEGGMVRLPRLIPEKLAMGLLLTGNRLGAAEALTLGLVNEVVPRDQLDDAVVRWVDDILACAPLSLRAIKQVVQRTAHMQLEEAQGQRLPALIEALESEDGEEGVLAFREKRTPVWKGR